MDAHERIAAHTHKETVSFLHDLRRAFLPLGLLSAAVGLAGIPDDASTWGVWVKTYFPILQNTPVVIGLLAFGIAALSLFWGDVLAERKVRRLLATSVGLFPDMTISELFAHYVQVNEVFYSAHNVGNEIRDKFSVGQLIVWGRRVRSKGGPDALRQIEPAYWSEAMFIYTFLYADDWDNIGKQCAPTRNQKLPSYTDVRVNRAQVYSIWPPRKLLTGAASLWRQ